MQLHTLRFLFAFSISTALVPAAQFSAPVVFSPGPEANYYVVRTPSYQASFSTLRPEFSVSGVRFRFEHSRSAKLIPGEVAASKSNFFIGNDRRRWRTNVDNYSSVRYANVYAGVDAVFYGNGSEMEYDLVVAPKADPGKIALTISGAEDVRIDADGNLLVSARGNTITQHRPRVFTERAGLRTPVECRYVLDGRTVRLALGEYDANERLTVDPVLSFATYIGGSRSDSSSRMAVDAAGNVYLTGDTSSTDFPVSTGVFRGGNAGASDLYIVKFNARGALVFASYLGGSGAELGAGIAVDSAGNIFVTGSTTSTNFPTSAGAFQGSSKGGTLGLDAFAAKLSPTGAELLYSTYLGGNDDEIAFGIAVDGAGSAYLVGTSASLNFPVSANAYQSATAGLPVYVTKLNSTGTALVYSTLVGGNRSDLASAVAVDAGGNAYVVGDTSSTDFPTTTGAYQTGNRGGTSTRSDIFVFKLNSTGSGLVYSTLLGGTGDELGTAIAVDAAGNAYVAGRTASLDFPTSSSAVQKSLNGSTDAVIAKINPSGTQLLFSTYFGGSRTDVATSIAVDSSQNVYVGGNTTSSGLSFTGASQAALGGGQDAFVLKLNPTGTTILQGTYFGGTDDEIAGDIGLDGSGNVYLFGDTASTSGIATNGVYQTRFAGGATDLFLAKLSFSEEAVSFTVAPTQLAFQASQGNNPKDQTVQITAASGAFPAWQVDVTGAWLSASPKNGSGTATITISANAAGLQPGSYSGSVVVTNVATSAKTTIPVTFAISAPGGQITQAGIVNGGSFLPGPVAAGEIVTIFGSGIGPATLAGLQLDPATGLVSTKVAETRVLFDGVAAPLIYVSAGQASAVVPYAVATKTTTSVEVEYKGLKSNAVSVPVAAAAPAIFTADSSGKGNIAALNEDGSYNSASTPAPKESIVVFYASGGGQTNPPGVDGKPASDVFPKPVLPVTVRIGGKTAEALYSGAAPGFVAGVLQFNVRIPADVDSGSQPVTVSIGSITTQAGVTVAVK